jgi:hypothetical protein
MNGPCKFYEKRDIEMGFAAAYFSTHKVFTHALEGLNVYSVLNCANI